MIGSRPAKRDNSALKWEVRITGESQSLDDGAD
jgi:hypothetical protein